MADERFYAIAAAAYAADTTGASWRGAGAKSIVNMMVDEEASISDRDKYLKSELYDLAVERQRHLMPGLLKRARESAARASTKDFAEIEPSFGILSSMHLPRAIEAGKNGRCLAPQEFEYATFMQYMNYLTAQGAAIAEGLRECKRVLAQHGEYWRANPKLKLPTVIAVALAAE